MYFVEHDTPAWEGNRDNKSVYNENGPDDPV